MITKLKFPSELLEPYLDTAFNDISVELQNLIEKIVDQLVNPTCSQADEKLSCYAIAWNNLSPEKRKELVFVYENTQFLVGFHGLVSERQRWNYWAKKPYLLAREVIPLMNGIDPECWEENKKNHWEREKKFELLNVPVSMVDTIKRFLEMAESSGDTKRKPLEWLAWGHIHGLDKPTLKSKEWISEPDVCMWSLFASAVYRLERFTESDLIRDACDSDKKKDCNIKDAPPGKLSHIAIGKLVVKAAWYIECETGKKASARETISKLQSWMNTTMDDEGILREISLRGVQWMTISRSILKTYDVEACGQTLKRWRESYIVKK